MNEQMDKLVEEIRGIYGAGEENRLPDITPQELIARIGKAFRDGELDEMLGVVGRGHLSEGRILWTGEEPGILPDFHGPLPFIAFRPETEKKRGN